MQRARQRDQEGGRTNAGLTAHDGRDPVRFVGTYLKRIRYGNRVPPYAETQSYVRAILARLSAATSVASVGK